MSAAGEETAGGKLGAEFFCRPARLGVAVAIRKPNDAVGVRYVKELRLRAGRIKRDPEWIVQAAIGKDLWLSAAWEQDLDGIGVAFGDEDVAIRRRQKEPGIVKAAGVFLNLETGWNLRLGAFWPSNDLRAVIDRLSLKRRRQIIDGDFVPHAGRILGPIGGDGGRAGQGFAILFCFGALGRLPERSRKRCKARLAMTAARNR